MDPDPALQESDFSRRIKFLEVDPGSLYLPILAKVVYHYIDLYTIWIIYQRQRSERALQGAGLTYFKWYRYKKEKK